MHAFIACIVLELFDLYSRGHYKLDVLLSLHDRRNDYFYPAAWSQFAQLHAVITQQDITTKAALGNLHTVLSSSGLHFLQVKRVVLDR